jgi:hypothetical protein
MTTSAAARCAAATMTSTTPARGTGSYATRTRPFGGINLFSIAKLQSEAEQRELWKQVEHYRDAQPVYPDPAPADAL